MGHRGRKSTWRRLRELLQLEGVTGTWRELVELMGLSGVRIDFEALTGSM